MLGELITRLSFSDGWLGIAVLEVIGGFMFLVYAIQHHMLPSMLPSMRGMITRRQILKSETCPSCSGCKGKGNPHQDSTPKARVDLPPNPRSRPGTADTRKATSAANEPRLGLRRRQSLNRDSWTSLDFPQAEFSSAGEIADSSKNQDKASLMAALEEARDVISQLQAELDEEREAAEAAATASLSLIQQLHSEKFKLQLKINEQQRQLEAEVASPGAYESLNVIVSEQDNLMVKMEEQIEKYKLAIELMSSDVNPAKLAAMRKQGLLGELWNHHPEGGSTSGVDSWMNQGLDTGSSSIISEQAGMRDTWPLKGESLSMVSCPPCDTSMPTLTLNDVDGLSPAKRSPSLELF